MPDIVVKNQAELDAALRAATGGETIKLLAGTYASVALNDRNFASNVTVTSADPGNSATIQRIALSNSGNLTFQGLTLARDLPATDPDYTQLHNVTGSSNIVFDSVRISGGSGDATKSLGWGLFVRNSANITLKNSTIDHTSVALQVSNVDGMVIKDNTFTDNRRDAMDLASVHNTVIDGNLITNMYPVNGEHPDGIQFFTNGTTVASSNITIKNNIIMQGDGHPIQGIFMRDEVGTLPYTNVDITNNLIYINGLYNGISVAGGKNVNVQQNTVVSQTDDNIAAWIRLEKVDTATVAGNVADRLLVDSGNSNITVGNNSWLSQDSATLRKFSNLNAAGLAKLSGMIVGDLGYHPPAGSAAAILVAKELAETVPSPTRNLVLDLEFKAAGLTDQSRFNSSATTAALDLSNVANGTYHVQTGAGFEVSRPNSVQVFALPAFTLSFDLQRDSATATAGQIVGIFQSWSVSLQSNGELNFTIKNDAGTSYSIVTQGAKLFDTKSHKIGVTFDGVTGRAVIYVDSVAKGTGAVSGSTRSLESWGLYVGNQFGTAFSGRIGNIEMRDQALTPTQIATLNTASNFGVLKRVQSFAGIVGQIISGTPAQSAQSATKSPVATGSDIGGLNGVAAVGIVFMPTAVASLTRAGPGVALTSLVSMKRAELYLLHS